MSSSVQFHSIDAFDVEGDAFRLSAPSTGGAWKSQRASGLIKGLCSAGCCAVAALISLAAVTLLMSATALLLAQATWRSLQQQQQQQSPSMPGSPRDLSPPPLPQMPPPPSFRPVSRIAFGSCTSHDLRPQPIWGAVIAVQPDAWIWVGDMAYTDNPLVDCK